MKLIWTKSKLPLSKAIRWALSEPVSHFAIVFDEKLVFQSNLLGVHPEGIYAFEAGGAEIIYSIKVSLSSEQEEAIYQSVLQHYEGKGYDYKAFAFFTWRALLYKFFGTSLPKTNPWDSSGFLCVGLADALKQTTELPQWLRDAVPVSDALEIMTPYSLYLQISYALPKPSDNSPSDQS